MTRREQTISYLQELMGGDTTTAEAKAMKQILDERDLIADDMTDAEFFALIPLAVETSQSRRQVTSTCPTSLASRKVRREK
jgi:hypothetical protein